MSLSTEDTAPVPLELIFSCGLCLDTVRDIYNNFHDNKGFGRSLNANRNVVVKFWLTECGHLTCYKHLEGGGAPFHPAGQPSRAPCPVCSSNSQSQVALYPIYGINQGFYDPAIPKAYFESPPVQLDRSEPGSDALRFHYLTLIRNGTLAHQRLRQAEREKGAAENARDAQKRQVQDLNQQNIGLQAKVDELEAKAKKLRAWQEREPAIVHYLGIVNALADETRLLRSQLNHLGYKVPETNYSLSRPEQPILSDKEESQQQPWSRAGLRRSTLPQQDTHINTPVSDPLPIPRGVAASEHPGSGDTNNFSRAAGSSAAQSHGHDLHRKRNLSEVESEAADSLTSVAQAATTPWRTFRPSRLAPARPDSCQMMPPPPVRRRQTPSSDALDTELPFFKRHSPSKQSSSDRQMYTRSPVTRPQQIIGDNRIEPVSLPIPDHQRMRSFQTPSRMEGQAYRSPIRTPQMSAGRVQESRAQDPHRLNESPIRRRLPSSGPAPPFRPPSVLSNHFNTKPSRSRSSYAEPARMEMGAASQDHTLPSGYQPIRNTHQRSQIPSGPAHRPATNDTHINKSSRTGLPRPFSTAKSASPYREGLQQHALQPHPDRLTLPARSGSAVPRTPLRTPYYTAQSHQGLEVDQRHPGVRQDRQTPEPVSSPFFSKHGYKNGFSDGWNTARSNGGQRMRPCEVLGPWTVPPRSAAEPRDDRRFRAPKTAREEQAHQQEGAASAPYHRAISPEPAAARTSAPGLRGSTPALNGRQTPIRAPVPLAAPQTHRRMELADFLRREDYDDSSRSLFSAGGRRVARR